MATKNKNNVTEKTGAVEAMPVMSENVEAEAEEVKTAKVETAEAGPEKSSTPEKAVGTTKEKKKVVKAASAKDKSAAKKPAAKKEMKVKAVVEYQGKQVDEKDIIAAVKKAWTRSGRKVRDIKSVALYIKPEEDKVYYVINGTDTGAVAF